ncbi:MAG: hypothetical protein ACRCYU_11905 [Nocardioides sp.]
MDDAAETAAGAGGVNSLLANAITPWWVPVAVGKRPGRLPMRRGSSGRRHLLV